MPDDISLGELVRRTRLDAGIKQSELVSATGSTSNEISHVENGRRPLSDALRKRVEEYLGPIDTPERRAPDWKPGSGFLRQGGGSDDLPDKPQRRCGACKGFFTPKVVQHVVCPDCLRKLILTAC